MNLYKQILKSQRMQVFNEALGVSDSIFASEKTVSTGQHRFG